MLAASFNKLILILNFIYLVFAFYFYVTWELEVAKASFNPLFSKRDLEKDTRFHLKAQVENVKNGTSIEVLVTNMDENGCFVLYPSAQTPSKEFYSKAHYNLKTTYEGVDFSHEAQLISHYDTGVGLEFIQLQKNYDKLNWSDLYKVCLERGLFN